MTSRISARASLSLSGFIESAAGGVFGLKTAASMKGGGVTARMTRRKKMAMSRFGLLRKGRKLDAGEEGPEASAL